MSSPILLSSSTTTTLHPARTFSSPTMHTAMTPTSLTLADVDLEFEQVGCLGHGGFGSVFLARKRSGRRLALKFIYLDEDEEDRLGFFAREVAAVRTLISEKESQNRDLAIVQFEGAFVGKGFACIAMRYCDGGSLADAIANRRNEPFTERRIASYALQLSEALAYAHSKGVAHHDVKSANVLIDHSRGGKLVLVDFGSAVAPGEESIVMTEIYAPPELLHAHATDDYSGIIPEKIDSFGLGCILFELVCCRKLLDLTGEQTLAEFVQERGVDAAMNLSDVRLPWLDPNNATIVGYSNALRSLVSSLIEPDASKRWNAARLQAPLRQDPQSPLLANYIAAAHPVVPGAAVTVDNIQLGMFVQRGKDWSDGDADGGGQGCIGVVVELDADTGYTNVVWPHGDSSLSPMVHRIGEKNMFELQVGPTSIFGSADNPRWTGLIETTGTFQVGQKVGDNCIVVAVRPDEKLILASPVNRVVVPKLPVVPENPSSVPALVLRKPLPSPDTWQTSTGTSEILVEVTNPQEQGEIINHFYAAEGGVDLQRYEIVSMKRVQCDDVWNQYAQTRESIAANNWGSPNESRLFWGVEAALATTLVQNPAEFVQKCHGVYASEGVYFFQHSLELDQNIQVRGEERKMVLSRVTLGRMHDSRPNAPMDRLPSHNVPYHSVRTSDTIIKLSPTQAYPEYVITYNITGRRIVKARRPGSLGSPPSGSVPRSPFSRHCHAITSSPSLSTGSSSVQVNSGSARSRPDAPVVPPVRIVNAADADEDDNTKLCVICLEKPVCRVAIPCGHVSLCQLCSSQQGLQRLGRRCPECRANIREVIKFYGRVVNEE